ncbi:MAG TPA: lysylphosphatidylglycerol synthase domain-containing protein [Gemmatimonadaceae bacterium]|nr:lysylphosphatidylglycerol synthase domain-containing protein [Gemmatimonadaceae bacterium]
MTAKRSLFLAAQFVAAAVVLYFVVRALAAQWDSFRAQPLEARPVWWAVVVSGVIVLLAYALLVQTWRVLLDSAGQSLGFWRAARIWTISNLWRYVPGKVWQIPAMSGLARQANVSAAAAAGSAVLSTVLNIASGLAIVLALGWRWVDTISPSARAIAIVLIILAALGLIVLPFVLAQFGAWVARLSGRQVQLDAPPARTVFLATVGNIAAWLLYGVAFMWMVRGVIGSAAGATWQYIAVYTASYVVGYLILIAPGGIGPREGVMIALLPSLGLATSKQAVLIAGASRVWLTILEIVPGLLFMARDLARRRSSRQPQDVSNH